MDATAAERDALLSRLAEALLQARLRWQTKLPSAYCLEVRHGDTHAVKAFNGRSAWPVGTTLPAVFLLSAGAQPDGL